MDMFLFFNTLRQYQIAGRTQECRFIVSGEAQAAVVDQPGGTDISGYQSDHF